MHVDSCTTTTKNGRTYTRHLLRENYREGRKVKHRTVTNLSACSDREIEAIKLALRHKDDLENLRPVSEAVSLHQGLSVGAVAVVHAIARELGIADALGHTRDGKLALWQVIARVIDQGSRLSAVRLATNHAACEIVGLGAFNEDHLYANLDWLAEKQSAIEDRLFRRLHGDGKPGLYLYDVTSSYLEGTHNKLAAFGYNRDGKNGKLQIVIGLLCNAEGEPLSIEVFVGNTCDPSTVASQIAKAAGRFGAGPGDVTFVGDRGMLKSRQVEDVTEHGFHYITAITKPQIRTLLGQGVIQMNLFDQELAEVTADEGVRYIIRRNPERVAAMRASRDDKLASLRELADKQTRYLAEHPRAHVEASIRAVERKCEKLKLSGWVTVSATGRQIEISVQQAALAEAAKLDGCYVLKTDLSQHAADKHTIHSRYKDLALVEQAFRTSKTVELEMRPINVRLESRTRGHAFVVMLAYRIARELARRWARLDLTVQEGLDQLATLCATELRIDGVPRCNKVPEPRDSARQLVELAGVTLPAALPVRTEVVATRKKLPERRKSR